MNQTGNFVIILTLILNFLIIPGFVIGKNRYKNEESLNFLSKFTVLLGIFFFFYILGLSFMTVWLFILHKYIHMLILSGFIISPFILGHFSSYDNADYFINLQIFLLIISFTTIIQIHRVIFA